MTFKPARFLDPKNDLVFKRIFGQNPELTKSFLNGILPFEKGHLIEKLEYLTPEQSPRIPTMKNTIADVKCYDQTGKIFIVEMQLHWTNHFARRLLFGTSKAYIQQLDAGDDYSSLCPVYGLGIVNYIYDTQSEDWFHHYRTVSIKNSAKTLEGLELVLLELPKFKPQNETQSPPGALVKEEGILWLRFLQEINDKVFDVPLEFIENTDIRKALEIAQECSYTRAELYAYDKYWDAVSVERTLFNDAERRGMAKGMEKGMAEGMAKGIAKGISKGMEEGRKEGSEEMAMIIAQNMLAAGIPLDVITKCTGIPYRS